MSPPLLQKAFLSASVPLPTRNKAYFETADTLAIRDAVRALIIVVLERDIQLVFGGHPAISPMIRLQIAQAGVPVGQRVVMYQSQFFRREFPKDNDAFERVELVDEVPGDREASLFKMRQTMLAGPFQASIFIGGMEGVEEEYSMFRERHPKALRFPVASTGAAAARLFDADSTVSRNWPELRDEISYLTLMRHLFK